MKYLLLIVVVVVVVWLLVPRRRAMRDGGAVPPRPKPGAQTMVVCAHCGVHLPEGEALPGAGGVFCSEAHRLAHEASRRG